MERVGAKDRDESSTQLTSLEAAFLDTVMRSFVKGVHEMDIERAAAWVLTSVTRSFSGLYLIVEEAWCTKIEVEKLEEAGSKDAEYFKNLAEKRFHVLTQQQGYSPWPSSLPSIAPKSNTRPGLSGNIGSNTGSQNPPIWATTKFTGSGNLT